MWPGIDRSLVDFDQVQTVPMAITKVVEPLFKQGLKSFIGTKERLDVGEIIQVGNLNQKYKVVVAKNKMLVGGGFRNQVVRADGYNITMTDINAISIGDKVKIKSRKTFQKRLEDILENPED